MSHTPGPWKCFVGDKDKGAMSEITKANEVDFRIGHVLCESRNAAQRDEDIDNAYLIAAAPDMLEVLEMIETLDRPFTVGEKRRITATIAKAKQRTS